MTIQTALHEELKNELDALMKKEIRPWMQIGLLLDKIDRSGFWKEKASSFTEWIQTFRLTINLKEASLWRYFTAARYYQKLHQDLTRRGVSSPSPEELCDNKVSPENIEILSKLVRVVPDDFFLQLAKEVIKGTISRAKLRQTWEAYRPAMTGRTARGKKVPTPRVDLADSVQSNLVLEAEILTALLNRGPKLLCHAEPCLYKIFSNVSPDFVDSPTQFAKEFSFSAVAIVRYCSTVPLEFHGIEIYGHDSFGSDDSLWNQRKSYCDHLWLAIHERTWALEKPHLPPYVGLITVEENNIKTEHPGGLSQQSGAFTGDLVKGLLLNVLHG